MQWLSRRSSALSRVLRGICVQGKVDSLGRAEAEASDFTPKVPPDVANPNRSM